MAEEKLLTIRDASLILGISEKEVIDLAESGKLPAYKIGGLYLRFKRQQVEEYRRKHKLVIRPKTPLESSLNDRVRDFLYFNDFYIVSAIIIIIILLIIFRG
ncbi:MAG: helix-turn-helix domain-containing protein [Candidatus Omnitrophica bacterium]|nr:helix-turn-helix domain-containing protein [Candidatus Omnitrophota bacterium]